MRQRALAALAAVVATMAVAGVVAAGAVATPAAAQEPFAWSGRLAAGQTVEVRGINGRVRAEPSADGQVHVAATRRARRDDPASVRIEVVEHAGGVTVCAVYPTPGDAERPNECRPGGGSMSVRDNDVRVDFVVRVPADVRFRGATVNGDVEAEGLTAEARATTVNGDVVVRTAGFARASTVNGRITVRLGETRLPGNVRYSTVNGDIVLELPASPNAELRATTVRGAIESDFPVLMSGRIGQRSVRGTLGEGGPELRLSTVNGSIRLLRI
jgi:hypothetical protein